MTIIDPELLHLDPMTSSVPNDGVAAAGRHETGPQSDESVRALPPTDRRRLETAVVAARRTAAGAARAALDGLGVFTDRRPAHLDPAMARLRVGLRAAWRRLDLDEDALVAECAYAQWHHLLFARFLAENSLLLHPRTLVPATLADCAELAAELGEADAWAVAARFASAILPGIFRPDDPCVRLRLAPEGRDDLERILDGMPAEVFVTDDALGWTYQFWQKDRKDAVNAAEGKIGGSDLGPVTQLFTENYMVRFVLENSLGAWWAARHPDSSLVATYEYLRLDADGRPAAGSFDGWGETVAGMTVMDPCCGSGHFLVEAFSMLWRMRAEEEGLGPVEAQDAVLRDNLHGLELDARCVQVAMFAVALQAWKAGGGWRPLPTPHIACVGATLRPAAALDDERTRPPAHRLFADAADVGSLADPHQVFDAAGFDAVASPMEEAMAAEGPDPAAGVLGDTAVGAVRAVRLLSMRYCLLVTNPPFLALSRAAPPLRAYAESHYPEGGGELATTFVARAAELTRPGGSYGFVLPQNYLFLGSYRPLRERNLTTQTWNAVARIGTGGFATICGEVVNVVLAVCSLAAPPPGHRILALDVQDTRGSQAKARLLMTAPDLDLDQARQLANPEARFTFTEAEHLPMLAHHVETSAGIQTGDYPRFGRSFWEVTGIGYTWVYQQSTPSGTVAYGGREHVIRWEGGNGELLRFVSERLAELSPAAWLRGTGFQGRRGVAVKLMGDLQATLFDGTLFDNNVGVVVPKDPGDLAALWAFCSSPGFGRLVRSFNPSRKAEPSAVAKIPFDIAHWRRVAERNGPLPAPWSDDPTQWTFDGLPAGSRAPLQVAVARLLGYRWPEQARSDVLDAFTADDGIVCLPAVAGEQAAADRLTRLLAVAYGDAWSPALLRELLERSPSRRTTLAEWLRDDFFRQHCALFGNRPFGWHVWDGLPDGFSALVDYHRLDRETLAKLTRTYLGQDWVERQRADARDEVSGADARLTAALDLRRRLELILQGEAPHDVYARWKDDACQADGWDPDRDDGVRLNIRPFVTAGVLRAPVNVTWNKDRGRDADGSERHNDRHLTLAQKRAARAAAGRT